MNKQNDTSGTNVSKVLSAVLYMSLSNEIKSKVSILKKNDF